MPRHSGASSTGGSSGSGKGGGGVSSLPAHAHRLPRGERAPALAWELRLGDERVAACLLVDDRRLDPAFLAEGGILDPEGVALALDDGSEMADLPVQHRGHHYLGARLAPGRDHIEAEILGQGRQSLQRRPLMRGFAGLDHGMVGCAQLQRGQNAAHGHGAAAVGEVRMFVHVGQAQPGAFHLVLGGTPHRPALKFPEQGPQGLAPPQPGPKLGQVACGQIGNGALFGSGGAFAEVPGGLEGVQGAPIIAHVQVCRAQVGQQRGPPGRSGVGGEKVGEGGEVLAAAVAH